MTIKPFFFGIFLLIFDLSTALSGQSVDGYEFRESYQYHIKRSTEPIKLDGLLAEGVWSTAQVATDFWYIVPEDGKQAEDVHKTEVMMTYDDRFIYVGARCAQPEAEIVVNSLKRDGGEFWGGEVFGLILDPLAERQNGFIFATNPAGVQMDVLVSGNLGTRSGGAGGGFNSAWNNKWQVETTVHDDHYIVEMAVPFNSLRYSDNKVWAFNFNRGVTTTNSFQAWTPVPVQFFGPDLGYTASLIWDEVPKASKSNIAVIPYVLGTTFKDVENDQPAENNFQVGLDAKVALTSALNLDLTINPDFSQVDVDRQVTNLTTVNVRFPEQRIFFVENSDIFNDFGIPPMRPFFSRRIGLDENGQAIPISYGARLTGNLTKNTRIGLMNLQTKSDGVVSGNNYSALSFSHQVFGRSVIKGFLHNRVSHLSNEFDFDDYTRNGSIEFDYRSKDGNTRLASAYGLSFSDGVSDLNDYYHFIVSTGNRNWSFYTNWASLGTNYDDSLGFFTQKNQFNSETGESTTIGYDHLFTRISYQWFPKSSKINNQRLGLVASQDWTREGIPTLEEGNLFNNRFSLSYNIAFSNTSRFSAEVRRVMNELLFPFQFTENPLPAAEYMWNEYELSYRSDNRKLFNYSIEASTGGFFSGQRNRIAAELNFRQQPWGNFGVSFETNELTFDGNIGNTTLFLVGPQIEFSFNRDLFWTTFMQYNTQADNFNINSRFQWRFQPLSDLFVVYTDNYAIDIWGPKNRSLVVKLNYWLNL